VRVIISSSRSLLAAPNNIRNLTELKPKTLAIMHGSSFVGDAEGAIRALADRYEARLREALGIDGPPCEQGLLPLLADFVAKVENRTTLKISRRLIFRPLCCCVAFQRHYGAL